MRLWMDDKLCADKPLVKLAGMEVSKRECIVSGSGVRDEVLGTSLSSNSLGWRSWC